MYTWKKNLYNSKKVCSPQIFECKVLDHGSTKQTQATLSVTVPEEDGGISCGTSLNQALRGSIRWKHLSATVCQKSAWPALPTDRHPPVLPYVVCLNCYECEHWGCLLVISFWILGSVKPVALLCFYSHKWTEKPASQRYYDENGMMTRRACSLVLG
jgi:hypothetical protein